MTDSAYNVLFLCTGNSARSILAEGLLNHLGRGRFVAHSAGSFPRGEVHPLAIQTLKSMGIGGEGFRSKSWDEFSAADAPRMHLVFTVCDQAAGEVCPVWPGQPITAHWGVEDPAAVEGDDQRKREAFHQAALRLKRRIELFVALPVEKLLTPAVKEELQAIGSR